MTHLLDPAHLEQLAVELTRREADRILLEEARAILRTFYLETAADPTAIGVLQIGPVLALAVRLNGDLGTDAREGC
jgi:hypothetical protein